MKNENMARPVTNHQRGAERRQALISEIEAEGNVFLRVDMVPVQEARSNHKAFLVFACGNCGGEFSYKVYDLTRFRLRCKNCSTYGFNPSRDAVLYLLARDRRGRQERQYGITTNVSQRMSTHRNHGWSLVDAWSGIGSDVLRVENEIKNTMRTTGVYRREFREDGFSGWTEAWSSDHLIPFNTLRALTAWVDLIREATNGKCE